MYMRDALSKAVIEGVTGTIAFDANGDAVKSLMIVRFDETGYQYYTMSCPKDFCNCPVKCKYCKDCSQKR